MRITVIFCDISARNQLVSKYFYDISHNNFVISLHFFQDLLLNLVTQFSKKEFLSKRMLSDA